MRLQTLLRLLQVPVLLSLLVCVSSWVSMTWLIFLAVVSSLTGVYQATTGCKNCINLGKAEKAMFQAHSDACQAESPVPPKMLQSLFNGQLSDDPALKSHVYCVLLKCKVISKDGKLQKSAVIGKMLNRATGKNTTKAIDSCADQSGDTPEDLAWNIFRCGYDKKAILFNYMPTQERRTDIDNNSN